jgi:alpha(1,3/1,4) fucosyltransferase
VLAQNITDSYNKHVAVVPTIGHSFEEMFIEKNTFFSSGQGKNPMYIIRETLKSVGIILLDATEIDITANCGMVLYFGNIDIKSLMKFKNAINVYIAFEPPAVDTTNSKKNLKSLRRYFDYILTWDDDLVDGIRILKFNYSVDIFNYSGEIIPYNRRKLITNISGNKESRNKDELYSARVEVIEYIESLALENFDLYGTGWTNKHYKTYKGIVASKADAYSNYKFALCFENQKNLKGYITEKIWDCFISKTIPIYWGAENIEEYVPKACFIDYRDFSSIEKMVSYLYKVSEEQFNEYIQNIEKFIESDSTFEFQPQAFANIIIRLLDRKKKTSNSNYKMMLLQIIKNKIRIRNSVQRFGYIGVAKRLIGKISENI